MFHTSVNSHTGPKVSVSEMFKSAKPMSAVVAVAFATFAFVVVANVAGFHHMSFGETFVVASVASGAAAAVSYFAASFFEKDREKKKEERNYSVQ